MNISHQATRRAAFGIASCLLLASGQAHSAEQNLSSVPLFIDAGVDPNIMLVVDDSGSMGWEMLFSPEALAAHSSASDRDNLDFSPDNDEEARRLCPAYNVMAYNPASSYTPWVGVDQYGNAFASIDDITEALGNPYCGPAGQAGDDCNSGSSGSNKNNITSHIYMTWSDNDGDTKYDVGECPDLPTETTTTITTTNVRAGNWYCQDTDHPSSTYYRGYGYCRNESYDWTIDTTTTVTEYTDAACRADSNCVVVDDLTADQKENYGNWYSYYRKRDYVAKKATLALVDQSSVRMGLGTLHDNNDVGRLITDMDDGDSSTTADATAKATLLQQIARIDPGSSTPTRQALYDAGEYYRTGDDDLFDGRYSSASSPILPEALGGQCQQNFTVVLTDGFTKGGYSSVGNTDSDGPGDFDGGVYADSLSNTLADVAMKYYEEDLSATLADFVPSSNGTSDLMHQHMVTYTVAFGIEGNLTCNPALTSCAENWPTSINYSSDDPNTIDDVWHAAVNGRGKYLAADDPQQLIDYLSATLDNIDARTSSSAAVAANSTTLNTGTVIYQALFNTGDWHGNLRSLSVSIGSTDTRAECSGVAAGLVCPTALWETATVLNTQDYSTGRTILTTKPSTSSGIKFRWPTNYSSPGALELDTSQVNALLGNAPTGDQQDYGQDLLNYLRGQQTNEGTNGRAFRERATTVLGDIINSAPGYVGAPRFSYPDSLESPTYASFQASFEPAANARTAMVYVAANDGMLHGFNAATGIEEIAYVPSMIFNKLEDLSEIDYAHDYIVDGSPTTGDVFYGSSWHSVLVGSLRAGGQGIFALDITNPGNFAEANASTLVLWEYTDNDLGYTFSQPDIVKLNNGRWAAIFGNGYNNTEADGSASTTGFAYLYVVDIETGVLITKISTATGSTTTPNGLATVTPVDENQDYKVDYIYAGDLLGNLWKFDMRGTTPGSWDVVKTGTTPTPLFTAIAPETGNPAQPITTRPSVAFHPDPLKDGFLIYFGTGSYIESGDRASSGQDTQTFYAVWDDLSGVPPTFARGSNYLQQTIIAEPTISGTNANGDAYAATLRITSDNAIDWSTQYGWYLDLVDPTATPVDNKGERQVTNSIVRGDRVIFTTLVPNDVVCEYGGNSWLMELDSADGSRLDQTPLDVDGDGNINYNDMYTNDAGVVWGASGLQQDGIITEPVIIGSPDADKEYKLMNSSSGSTQSVLESTPGGLTGSRNSWIELW